MCSMHNEVKSLVAKKFIRILKNKIYKYMTPISKNVYIDKLDDKLDDIVNKYNNTYHSTIKKSLLMYHRTIEKKPADVNPSMYIDFDE